MLYLLHYDRAVSKLLSFKEYQDADRSIALNDWRDLEIRHNLQDGSQEVVLLQAQSRDQLRRTHPKYEIPQTTGEKLFVGAVILGVLFALTAR
jgi:hypothetical protein